MEKLYLGVSKKDITPKVGCRLAGYLPDLVSTGVHDPLDAVAFSFMQGSTRAIIISATIVTLETDHADEIRALVSKECDVPVDNVTIACTHTHTGPTTFQGAGFGTRDEEYCNEILIPRIIEAAKEATDNRTPVTMGYSTGESYIGINRRELTVENKVELGQNPWGPYNPRMTVISFKNSDGACLANMIHFGMHGTCAGKYTEISQDFAGVMVRRMDSLTGGVTAFFNGPEGDIGPRLTNGMTGSPAKYGEIEYAMETGGIAARDAMNIWKKIKNYSTPTLTAYSAPLTLPVKPRPTLDEARAAYKEIEGKRAGVVLAAKQAYYKKVIDSYEEGCAEKEYDEQRENILALGNIKLVGTPFETFAEINMRIQKECPNDEVLIISCANGCGGYLPTESELCRGGYEVTTFSFGKPQPYADNTDWHFVKETLKNLST